MDRIEKMWGGGHWGHDAQIIIHSHSSLSILRHIRNGQDKILSRPVLLVMLPDKTGQDGSELLIGAAEDGVDIYRCYCPIHLRADHDLHGVMSLAIWLDLWNVFTFKIIISFSLSLLVSFGHIIECPVMRFYSIHNCIHIIMIHWHTSHWIRYITDRRIWELSCLNFSYGWWIGKEYWGNLIEFNEKYFWRVPPVWNWGKVLM